MPPENSSPNPDRGIFVAVLAVMLNDFYQGLCHDARELLGRFFTVVRLESFQKGHRIYCQHVRNRNDTHNPVRCNCGTSGFLSVYWYPLDMHCVTIAGQRNRKRTLYLGIRTRSSNPTFQNSIYCRRRVAPRGDDYTVTLNRRGVL